MDRGTVARIEDWEQRPFSGGYVGLNDLADAEFSGAVRSGQHWLFVLNGRVVGTAGGSIEDFAQGEGTAYVAPHPGLPLLFAMQERGGETKARYFTDDTPLEEVHETLSSGSFTGYVELSENVHSGDYYLVYYGGRALKLAFVGGTERLITDEDAFEQAADEVGIYEVRDVSLDVQDVPDPDDSTAGAAVASGETERTESASTPGSSTDASGGGAGEATDDREEKASAVSGSPNPESTPRGAESASPSTNTDASSASAEETEDPAPGESGPAVTGESNDTGAEEATAAPRQEASRTAPDRTESASQAAGSAGDSETRPTEATAGERGEAAQSDPTGKNESASKAATSRPGDATEDPFTEERAWRETKAVPALDPEESRIVEDPSSGAGQAESESVADDERQTAGESETVTEPTDASSDQLAELRAELAELRDRLETVETERDRLREERDELERHLERREQNDVAGEDGPEEVVERSMSSDEALDGTDLLVRYGSKSDPTLEDAHGDEGVTPQEVDTNLRLETHTRFDSAGVIVDGEPYDAFVADTLEYRFAAWVARTLLFEIRDTGNAQGLSDLYGAIPEIDRVEFDASITTRDEAGEERREQFDVTFRDQMGQPVAVANINDDRDPASGDMMADLVESANAVVEAQDSLSAAFFVTASFFEPTALETAEEATSAGLLNRDSRKSFVKTSRKRGYHLSLVEAHGDEFRIAVPDL